ncbi:MAG: 4Fe-4S binding protein [Deltaproteobacteria bacterium]|nr:4Fe-4S binding protein [Deltaproteobacteria bacterium]MBT6504213.1 4Fe-4S binding protein [Deltaproteobacteria bacterium]MBT7152437.1 4Fe-4S binding protein [Deltaproteobacteria bacterium]MBT7710599.1 4Fe-4S binding protein [Deltaproteobacteria bacterium]
MDMTPYVEMAKSLGFENSILMPKMFQMIVDADEAKIVLAASPPKTVEELAAETGFTSDRAQDLLDQLFIKGLIYKSKKPDATRYYKFRSYIQFHDGTVLTPGISQEYLDLWKEFEKTEMAALRDSVKEIERRQGMRVVPVNVIVEAQKEVMAPDDVVKMIDDADKIAVTNCSCRVIHGITDVPLEVCMQMNKAADYALDRGTGRELTKQEAMEMLKMCEDEGLIHCVDNKRDLGYLICNCDGVGCGNWGGNKGYAKTFTAPSRFKADVKMESCSLCEACLDRCFFDAISMTGEDDAAVIDPVKCMGCGVCIPVCEDDAISMKEIQPVEFIPV